MEHASRNLSLVKRDRAQYLATAVAVVPAVLPPHDDLKSATSAETGKELAEKAIQACRCGRSPSDGLQP